MLVKGFVKLTESKQQVHLQLLLHLEFSVPFDACQIASAHFADWRGTPIQSWTGYPPIPVLDGGGIWDVWTWDGVTPPPCPNLRWGTPPASVDTLKLLPSLIFQMWVVTTTR